MGSSEQPLRGQRKMAAAAGPAPWLCDGQCIRTHRGRSRSLDGDIVQSRGIGVAPGRLPGQCRMPD